MTYKFIDSSGKELPHVVIEGKYYVLNIAPESNGDVVVGVTVNKDHVRFISVESGREYASKILTTTDPSLGLPLIELEDSMRLALEEYPIVPHTMDNGQVIDLNEMNRMRFLRDYPKANEQFKFNEEDMVEFGIAVVNKYVGLLQQINPNIPVMEDFLSEFLSNRTKTITIKTK